MTWWARMLAWVLGITKRAEPEGGRQSTIDVERVIERVERLEMEARLIQRRRGAS